MYYAQYQRPVADAVQNVASPRETRLRSAKNKFRDSSFAIE